MRKRYIIMRILICIIALLGYLQYGREEQAVNTMVSTSDTFYKQKFDVIANKLFNLDKEKYAEELINPSVYAIPLVVVQVNRVDTNLQTVGLKYLV